MEIIKIEKLIQIATDRNEMDFLYNITKHVAESDSIGEGYAYCAKYTREYFNNGEMHMPDEHTWRADPRYCEYLEFGGLPIYEIYLKHLGIIE